VKFHNTLGCANYQSKGVEQAFNALEKERGPNFHGVEQAFMPL
jgi:hypothetical protein